MVLIVANPPEPDRTPESAKREAEYDRLLHKRKGLSGSQFAGIGVQFAVSIVVFAFMGIWLDKWLGTSSLFVLVMVLGGAGARASGP
jgi:F0F1-type ATP synthase assembly protein I